MRRRLKVTSLAEHLREARLAAGLTQRALAASSGVHLTLISRYERGRRKPSLGTLAELCSALGLSMDELLNRAKHAAS